MNILDQIVAHKRTEVDERKTLYPVKLLEKSIYYNSAPVSLKKYLTRKGSSGIIAEIKRKSPSKGMINKYLSIEKTSIGYMQAGAAALSILTDKEFFGGTSEDLTIARKFNYCPILRKDFIIDPYQIIEAKSIGADVILLLANVLKPHEIKEFAKIATDLGMEVLLELREESELDAINQYTELIGINNRDLKTFEVDTAQSITIGKLLPSNVIKISESGLSDPSTIVRLRTEGFQGFLMGEAFMKDPYPERACAAFINSINSLQCV